MLNYISRHNIIYVQTVPKLDKLIAMISTNQLIKIFLLKQYLKQTPSEEIYGFIQLYSTFWHGIAVGRFYQYQFMVITNLILHWFILLLHYRNYLGLSVGREDFLSLRGSQNKHYIFFLSLPFLYSFKSWRGGTSVWP